MVKDLKAYRDKTDAKPASSPGWFILIFSHVAILVLGISLGYWIGGRFSKEAMNQKTTTPEVATRKQEPPESTMTTEETAIQYDQETTDKDSQPILKIKGLHKKYNEGKPNEVHDLRGIDLEVTKCTFLGTFSQN